MKILRVFFFLSIAKMAFADNNFMEIVKTGRIEEVKSSLPKNGINDRDKYGRTALMHAARAGNVAVVKFLIVSGADVTLVDNYGFTAIQQLESLLRRSDEGMKEMVKGMRQQGLSEDTIDRLA